MAEKEDVVIDNDTRQIFVDGKLWLPSPESYMHLRPAADLGALRGKIEDLFQAVKKQHPGLRMYRDVGAL